METIIYFGLGIFTSIVVFLVGYASLGVFKLNKKVNELNVFIEVTDRRISDLERDINHKIDREIEDTHQTFRDVEIDLRSQLDSRLDKLMNQIIKKIPPTNDEVIKELKKVREEFLSLRQNL